MARVQRGRGGVEDAATAARYRSSGTSRAATGRVRSSIPRTMRSMRSICAPMVSRRDCARSSCGEARAKKLHVAANQIERRADFMRELRGCLSGGGEAFQLRQAARRAATTRDGSLRVARCAVPSSAVARERAPAGRDAGASRSSVIGVCADHAIEAAREQTQLVRRALRRFDAEVARFGARHGKTSSRSIGR